MIPDLCPRCNLPPKVGALWPGGPKNRCMNGSFGNPCGQELGAAPKKPRAEREAPIQRRIQKYLAGLAPEVYAWRNNVGRGTIGSHFAQGISGPVWHEGRDIHFGQVGSADILCCAWGYFLAIEVKTSTGRQSEAQRDFEARIDGAFGDYIVARSVEDVMDAIERLRARMREDAWFKMRGRSRT